jgi:hypothetical protein
VAGPFNYPVQNSMSPIALTSPKVVSPAIVVTEVTIERLVDLPNKKIVRAFCKELPQPINLWEGEAYDAIGNWTQAQAEVRLAEILNA